VSGRYGIEVRSANAADAPGLAELFALVGRAVDPAVLADRVKALQENGGAVLVATAWGPPSGLVALHWRRALDANTPTAEITTLLVRPDERRRGIGRLLLKTAAQAARTAGCGRLLVAGVPEAEHLEVFCRATGFVEAGARWDRPLRKKS
jgi:GNAT superfamily N-acetyltransferase